MMSQTVDYALRAMGHLAAHPEETCNSRSIALAVNVPKGYLSKILGDLVRAHLVESSRGPHGGFRLVRPPQAICLLDVISAVDPIRRLERSPRAARSNVSTDQLSRCLDDALAQLERTFRQTTLAFLQSGDARAGEGRGKSHSPASRPWKTEGEKPRGPRDGE
jgi:Rrf2 family protein